MTRYALGLAGLLLVSACGTHRESHYADSPTVPAPARPCIYLERTYPDGALITPSDRTAGTTMRCVNGYWESRPSEPPSAY